MNIALTAGEPAGIGPDLCVQIAQNERDEHLVVVADPAIISERAAALNLPLEVIQYTAGEAAFREAGRLTVRPVHCEHPVVAGQLSAMHANYVINTLNVAADGCSSGEFAALVTAPVHKGNINDAGIPFSGHTEHLADRSNSTPVMLLHANQLRVALATTHLPLRDVADAISADQLEIIIRIIQNDLKKWFGYERPRIAVCGLNPHAGEQGHLGSEEIEIIEPLLERLRQQGFDLIGPLPADTAFTPPALEQCDVVLAMYHDQGLTALKALGFGEAVNVTLGLPIIRTSVDHGTALSLAGTGQAKSGSLRVAIDLASRLARSSTSYCGTENTSIGAHSPAGPKV